MPLSDDFVDDLFIWTIIISMLLIISALSYLQYFNDKCNHHEKRRVVSDSNLGSMSYYEQSFVDRFERS